MGGPGVVCSAVRFAFRLVTPANTLLPFLPEGCSGENDGASAFTILSLLRQTGFVFSFCCHGEAVRTCFERDPVKD
jgi:hypothetical protein